MAVPLEIHKPEQSRWRYLRGLTGNALITALIAVIVSGVTWLAVAHYQVRNTDGRGREVMAASSEIHNPKEIRKREQSRWRYLRGLTGNALITALIAAIVSGVISFAIAHYQVQGADRQALAGQQASAIVQLEASATTYWQDIAASYGSTHHTCKQPICQGKVPSQGAIEADLNSFLADLDNVSDPTLRSWGDQFFTDTIDIQNGKALPDVPLIPSNPDNNLDITFTAYIGLMNLCGEIIQGQSDAQLKPFGV